MSGERLDTLPPYKRRVNTVFQHYALFPHLSVADNVAYGLRVKNTPASEIAGRVDASSAHGQNAGVRRCPPSDSAAASSSASLSLARSSIARSFFSSTSRSPPSTPTSASKCRAN